MNELTNSRLSSWQIKFIRKIFHVKKYKIYVGYQDI